MATGLDGVVAAQTRLSHIDGAAGTLTICGYAVEELAPRASFEEVTYLLWHDRLPNAAELGRLRGTLAENRALTGDVLDLLGAAAGKRCSAIDALRLATDALALGSKDDDPWGDAVRIHGAHP